VNRILKPVIYLLAAIYFLVDAVFMPIARPAADWLARRLVFDGLRRWIMSLRPYPALALLAVPVVVLEPIKPLAAYLAATGHFAASIAILIAGELSKLVLVERLFALTRDRLMSIPAFAWGYARFVQTREWLQSSEAWRAVRRIGRIAVHATRFYLAELRSSRTARRVNWQSR
jgi:hypothetical protein